MNKAIDNKTKIQKSILNKYLNRIENEYFKDIHEKYSVYQKIFNSNYKDQIINLKESEYEQIFQLRLFQTVLGYQIDIGKESPRNIKFQPKSKEGFADGGIYLPNADDIDKKNIAVIEMKDSKTKEINKINNQAFKYFRGDTNIKYTIICNFLRIRIYLDNTKDYIDFPIFNLSKDDFQLLYLFISYDSVLLEWPSKMKIETVHEEKKIEKRFYVDYSKFRDELFKNIVKNNTNVSELILFNRTQKLLDRFIFIFFAEDKGLIYPNFIESVISYWKDEKKRFGEKSLYEDFNRYFNLLDKGREKGHNTEAIFAFNGGLFMKDQVLENLKIDCDVLATNVQKLSSYDFTSQITVDILGHIFEHSLNDIEETQAKLNGKEYVEVTNKRKKDGVYYTPRYITEYIVVNTLGKLCDEKKLELDINEKTYAPSNKRSKKRIDNLNNYRNWLLGLTICDPACGSGAFLNQALSFLIDEHQYIDELSASYHKDTLLKSKKDELLYCKTSILENNLFGVDINEESVEIAKLSLWLRTTDEKRKLSNLSNNIKCGNSLIDDPEIAGDKAFNWKKEFPKVFSNGGFDLVIGNPPYVDSESMTKSYPNERNFISKNYESASGNWDLFIPFIEKGIQILKNENYLSFIIPNKVLTANYGTALRNLINKNYSIDEIYDLSKDNVFSVDVYPVILFISKTPQSSILKISKIEEGKAETFKINFKYEENWALYLNLNYNLYSKIIANKNTFDNNKIFTLYNAATVSEAYEIKEFIEDKDTANINQLKLINSGTIDPYLSLWGFKPITYIKERYSNPIINIENIKDKEWTKKPKIAIAGMALRIEAFLDIEGTYLPLKSTTVITANNKENLKYICAIINSKLLSFLFRIANSANTMAGGYLNVNKTNLNDLPIIYNNTVDIRAFSSLVEQILSLNKDLQETSSKFQRTLNRKFEILENLPKKLENWYELTFADFIKELKKKKIELIYEEEVKLEDYFLPEQKKALEIKAKINQTDKEIDTMVYKLYDLTNKEIAIIENESK